MAKQGRRLKKKIGASVSSRCYSDVLEKIKTNLNSENLARFEKSCFGHLLKYKHMKFQGQLMYLIMEHLDKRSLENGVLSFTINDHAADFGPVEYFVVTGLPWGEMEELPVSSELHHNIFQSKRDLRLSDLEKALTDTCKDNGSGDLALKLAYLVCVDGLLLSKDRKGKKLDIQYLHLIDDLSRFTSYPWGRISYEYLLHGVITARESMDRLKQKSNERPAFDVNGFTYALQAWAFEVFPSVGNHCGSLVDENSHLLPRILRWSASTFFQYRDLVPFFQTGVEFKLVPLQLTIEDNKALEDACVPHYSGVRVTGSHVDPLPLKKRTNKRKIEEKKTKNSKINWKRVRTLRSTCTTSKSPNMRSLNDEVEDMSGGESEETHSTLAADIGKSDKLSDVLRRVNRNEKLLLGLYKHFNISLPSEVLESLDGNAYTRKIDSPTHVSPQHEPVVETPIGTTSNLKHFEDNSLPNKGLADEDKVMADEVMGNTHVQKGLANEVVADVDSYFVDNSSKSYHEPEVLLNHLLDEVEAPIFDKPNESFNPHLDKLQSPLLEDPKLFENQVIVLPNTLEVKEPEIEVLSSVALLAEVPAVKTGDGMSAVPALKTFKRKLKPGKCILSPYNDPTVQRKKIAPSQVELIEITPKSAHMSPYNPNVIQPADVILKFNTWYRKPRNSAVPEVILPFFCLGKARPEWFKDIASRRGLLCNLHIDVLLNLLIIKSSITPESFLHNWTIIESYGSLKLLHEDYGSSLPILRMYAEGIRPEQRGKAWQDVDKVFGVAHVLTKHWVAYEIDLEEENIIVYDSLCTAQSWVEVREHFKHACHNIARLCKDVNVYGKKGGKTEFKQAWDLIRFENTPQQENHFDCGIMVVKFIESLAADFPIEKIDTKMTANFRDSFCAEVFSLGKVQD